MDPLTPLGETVLAPRLRHLLERRGIGSVEDLTTLTRDDLTAIRGFARKSLAETQSVLRAQGLSLLSDENDRRSAMAALYGTPQAAPLALVMFDHRVVHRLTRAGIGTVTDLLGRSEQELRGLTYAYQGNRHVVRVRMFEENHIETIVTRLRQIGLGLGKD